MTKVFAFFSPLRIFFAINKFSQSINYRNHSIPAINQKNTLPSFWECANILTHVDSLLAVVIRFREMKRAKPAIS